MVEMDRARYMATAEDTGVNGTAFQQIALHHIAICLYDLVEEYL